jgi:hypothetical protein
MGSFRIAYTSCISLALKGWVVNHVRYVSACADGAPAPSSVPSTFETRNPWENPKGVKLHLSCFLSPFVDLKFQTLPIVEHVGIAEKDEG